MDVLDKYKETWKNQPEENLKVSKVDIYKIMHKKSTSIVKWIFIIGIMEFIFVAVLNALIRLNHRFNVIYNEIKYLFIAAEVVSYIIIIYFLIKFYKNYKSISSSDDTKTLMNKILKTRKTVKTYILTVMITGTIFTIPAFIFELQHNAQENIETNFYVVAFILLIVVLAVMFLIYWCFYQLLYGFLLRKLKRNYKELAKLDELN